jgi:hypothetical protein
VCVGGSVRAGAKWMYLEQGSLEKATIVTAAQTTLKFRLMSGDVCIGIRTLRLKVARGHERYGEGFPRSQFVAVACPSPSDVGGGATHARTVSSRLFFDCAFRFKTTLPGSPLPSALAPSLLLCRRLQLGQGGEVREHMVGGGHMRLHRLIDGNM